MVRTGMATDARHAGSCPETTPFRWQSRQLARQWYQPLFPAPQDPP